MKLLVRSGPKAVNTNPPLTGKNRPLTLYGSQEVRFKVFPVASTIVQASAGNTGNNNAATIAAAKNCFIYLLSVAPVNFPLALTYPRGRSSSAPAPRGHWFPLDHRSRTVYFAWLALTARGAS